MYAARRLYVKQWDHDKPEDKFEVAVTRGGKPVPGIDPTRISYIEEEVMYWRKANHIHRWFVDAVQDGEDNCKSYYVSPENLRELLTLCEQVIEASELIDGTIHSSTRYDKDHPNGLVIREPGKVIRNPATAEELLPRQVGFFFGGKEYDEDYLADVVATRDWIVRTLADTEAGVPGEIYYSSSW